MEEVLTRRLTAYLAERDRPVDERRRRFAYPPQLLLVDGGKGQLGVAIRVLEELGLEDEIPVAALAKQFEEVYVPGQADPIRIPRTSEALYLLQRIRDEAHRFAITYHRQLRGKRMTESVLDDIPGLGPARRKRLVKELGGVHGGPGGVARDAARASRGCPTRWPTRCTTRLHGPPGRAGSDRLRSTRPMPAPARPDRRCRACRERRPPAVRAARQRPTASDQLGADPTSSWWQASFTDGADAEYTEQILPLAAEHLAGARPCSTSAAARARSAGWRRPCPARPSWSASTRPGPS